MRRTHLLLGLALLPTLAWTAPLSKLQIEITNSSDQAQSPEDIAIPIFDLKQAAPDLNPACLIVTADDGTELPSQVDDLDGDLKADALAFQINLKPRQRRTVTITYGDPDSIYRQRGIYEKRTNAIFATKIEGLGWESGQNAWRLYFDPRNAIDLYGKRRDTPFLEILATPEYNYHAESPNGRDIYKVGDALGIGAVGAWVDGKLMTVAEVENRKWRIVSSGPVRSIVQVAYEGWKVGGKSVNLGLRITQWAGDRGFYCNVSAEGKEPAGQVDTVFATGLPLKPKAELLRSDGKTSPLWMATYGEQVVQPGATATEEQPGTNLGLAIIFHGISAESQQDALNYLLTFPLQKNGAHWYVAAAWDQEGVNNGLAIWKPYACSKFDEPPPLKTKEAFLRWVREKANQIMDPAGWKILSAKR